MLYKICFTLNFLISSINYSYKSYNKIMTERNHCDIGMNGVLEEGNIS